MFRVCSVILVFFFAFAAIPANSSIHIHVNQVAWDNASAKIAVVETDTALNKDLAFTIVNAMADGGIVYTGNLLAALRIDEWAPGKLFYQADFSALKKPGTYFISLRVNGVTYQSGSFIIDENALVKTTLPSIIHYYNKQRANTQKEIAADKKMILFGSDKTADVHGGWCDASGDISKYFSHLAYTNFMLPQQTPLVTWSLIDTRDAIPALLANMNVKDAIEDEAIWGADYIMRSLATEGYFYMTVFSYFNPDPSARRIVGLLANSVTTADYQCGFREGGGMAIAALARISRWKKNGDFTAAQYLDAAKRAFAHLLLNNTRYADDGRENILDDYCALMASTELWIATGDELYIKEARKRAANLADRITDAGYFLAGDNARPYWHAADAGLPVIALARYLDIEDNADRRKQSLTTIKRSLEYLLHVTNNVANPFGYARQSFLYKGQVKDGFFIPHDNESGWWWQGENARLASLATAALIGGRLVYPGKANTMRRDSLARFAAQQVSWILGSNPYDMCFMYGFGQKNTPYMASLFGHGSEKGGISNGITGREGNGDGSGIDFKTSAGGNEWRWTEQWIPHAAYFLQAITAMTAN